MDWKRFVRNWSWDSFLRPTVTYRSSRPMTPDEVKTFNRAFEKFNEGFAEMDKVFKDSQ